MGSLYLLDNIDSLALRRNVQRALSRGENYHQLRRAVSYANFGKLRFRQSTVHLFKIDARQVLNSVGGYAKIPYLK